MECEPVDSCICQKIMSCGESESYSVWREVSVESCFHAPETTVELIHEGVAVFDAPECELKSSGVSVNREQAMKVRDICCTRNVLICDFTPAVGDVIEDSCGGRWSVLCNERKKTQWGMLGATKLICYK